MTFAQALRDALMRRTAERTGRFLVGQDPRPCWHCGDPTTYVEVNFEAPLHPGACTDAKEIEYWRAEAEAARRDRGTHDQH